MKAIDIHGNEVQIRVPVLAQGHVHPGAKPSVVGWDHERRGFWGQAPGPCGYYTAWWEIGGQLYFPVGDEHGHRP